ncbi:cupin domain-containing protein [Anabaena sp. UHCC 0399]|uniref:cupin domain-containing protein n=2 Tax=unclassified Anabaena TaxID=2619674 RepID=UPI002B1EB2A5|nr:cupin domain-containing protein [Anabaena sp. UHCC 0399]MEA5563995.1 cupin domain-containing protein [Anabaena sp. UHCC 0399]
MKLLRVGLISSLLLAVVMSSRVEAFEFPKVKPDSDASSYLFLPNGPITFLKRGETTGGKYALMETIVPPGGAAPPHIHHEEDEWLYVAEGNMQLVIGDSFYPDPNQIPGVNAPRDTLYAFDAPAGTLFYGRKNYIHGIRNVGTTTGKVLLVATPAGFEDLIAEVSVSVPDLANLPPYDPQTIYRFAAASVNYGLVGSASFEQFGDILVDHNFPFPDNHSDKLLALLADDVTRVPEPTLLGGILVFGATGAVCIRKRKSKLGDKVA